MGFTTAKAAPSPGVASHRARMDAAPLLTDAETTLCGSCVGWIELARTSELPRGMEALHRSTARCVRHQKSFCTCERFWEHFGLTFLCDLVVALGIVQRSGLGKVKALAIRTQWLQRDGEELWSTDHASDVDGEQG